MSTLESYRKSCSNALMAGPQNDEDIDGVAELADACVRYVQEALELELDYTPETLPILDHYLKSRMEDPKEELLSLLAPTAGAYFGEVVRRTVDGARWHCPSGHFAAHRIEFETFFLHFNPIGVAVEFLPETRSAQEDLRRVVRSVVDHECLHHPDRASIRHHS